MLAQDKNTDIRYEKGWIKFVAVAMFFLGLMNIASAWLSFDSQRLNLIHKMLEYHIVLGSRYLVILTGIASMILAPALYRQKRIAWYISVLILGISGFAHILKGADIEEAGLCLILFGVLLPLYRYCRIKSDPVRMKHGWQLLVVSIIFVALYTILGVHIFADRLGIELHNYRIWTIIYNALIFNTSGLHPIGIKARFYVDSLLVINSISYMTGLIFALSPVIARNLPDMNYDTLKLLVKHNSNQPVQFFTLSNDYQHYYKKNETSEGLISYKVARRVALAIGNPCVNGSLAETVEGWINTAKEHDWIPAVYQAQPEFGKLMKSYDFSAVPIGVEAIIDLNKFTLEGKEMQQLRTARNKAAREGWIVREYDKSDWNKVKDLDSKWLKIHGCKENSFAMGRSTYEYLDSTRTVLLFDKNENLLAYLNNIELLQTNTRSVDLMRRNPSAPQGAMEYIFLHEILAAKEDKKAFYDLGFSPLAMVDEVFSDNKVISNLFRLVFEKQKKYYDFQGLYQFKSKFNPEWHRSYLLYQKQIDLPNVLLALLDLNKG